MPQSFNERRRDATGRATQAETDMNQTARQVQRIEAEIGRLETQKAELAASTYNTPQQNAAAVDQAQALINERADLRAQLEAQYNEAADRARSAGVEMIQLEAELTQPTQ